MNVIEEEQQQQEQQQQQQQQEDDNGNKNDTIMIANDNHPTSSSTSYEQAQSQPPEAQPQTQQQRTIHILSNDVVEKIAAGEIIQRTSIAIKEVFENAIDAYATQIRIIIIMNNNNNNNSNNNCISFTIIDNGIGISNIDLPFVITRHATSKIQSYHDITATTTTSTSSTTKNNSNNSSSNNNNNMKQMRQRKKQMTFGFRGEAMAAIYQSCQSLSITSRTKHDRIAYQIQYHKNNNINNNHPYTMKRIPRATIGTTIQVQNLFYHNPIHQQQQQRTGSNSSNSYNTTEYYSILKILQYYAIHYASYGIAISCEKQSHQQQSTSDKKNSNSSMDLNTFPFISSSLQQQQKNLEEDDIPTTTTDGRHHTDLLKESKNQQQPFDTISISTATKHVIGHVMGSYIVPYLIPFTSELVSLDTTRKNENEVIDTTATSTVEDDDANSAVVNDNDDDTIRRKINTSKVSENDVQQEPIYSCIGYITSPTYYYNITTANNNSFRNSTIKQPLKRSTTSTSTTTKKTPILLFINHRYIEGCTTLRRMIEDTYIKTITMIMTNHTSTTTTTIGSNTNKGKGSSNITNTTSNTKNSIKIPFLYLHITVPNDTIDINVHPTKRDVILLHSDIIQQHLCTTLQQYIIQHISMNDKNCNTTTTTTSTNSSIATNLYQSQLHVGANRTATTTIPNATTVSKANDATTKTAVSTIHTTTDFTLKNLYKRCRKTTQNDLTDDDGDDDNDDDNYDIDNDDKAVTCKATSTQETQKQQQIATTTKVEVKHKSYIRTSRGTQSGSLEPFLVSRQQVDKNNKENHKEDTNPKSGIETALSSTHDNDCPLYTRNITECARKQNVDLSEPGAFTKVVSQCTCSSKRLKLDLAQHQSTVDSYAVRIPSNKASTVATTTTSRPILRLKRCAPSTCEYESIQQLRKRTIQKCYDTVFHTTKLRNAIYIGTMIPHRFTYIQCQDELLVMNHYECCRELFYQLSLNQFGSIDIANIESNDDESIPGIDIEKIIGQYVQLEEVLQSSKTSKLDDIESTITIPLKVSDTNEALAKQATACLLQHADMLLEYFSIRITTATSSGTIVNNQYTTKSRKAYLSGLPILIEGYEPSPHGLPLFLLRLASEVDWTNEKACFYGICREIGSYYAQISSYLSHTEQTNIVQHIFFPAITALLLPTKDLVQNEFVAITNLTKLYKVFERC